MFRDHRPKAIVNRTNYLKVTADILERGIKTAEIKDKAYNEGLDAANEEILRMSKEGLTEKEVQLFLTCVARIKNLKKE